MNVVDTFVNKYNTFISYTGYKTPIVRKANNKYDYLDSSLMYYFLNEFITDEVNGLGSFNLFKVDIVHPEGYVWIGSYENYNLEYLLDLAQGNIVLWGVDSGFDWPVAKNDVAFFKGMIEVLDLNIEMRKLKVFDLPSDRLDSAFKKCMSLNNNEEKYSPFYNHIIGLGDSL